MLTLAIPSKGRLKDNCNAWFAAAGVTMEQTVARAAIAPVLPALTMSK